MSLGNIILRNDAYITKESLPTGETVECAWIRATNPEHLRLLKKHQAEAGLDGLEIVLIVPSSSANVDPFNKGFAAKNGTTYYIGINPPSRTNFFHGRWYNADKEIAHEISHIKNGDCDRDLPYFIGWLYNLLWEEPRAKLYARKVA